MLKRVLVTGCNGQLGSDVVDIFLKSNYFVIGTDIKENNDYKHDNYVYKCADLSNTEMVFELFENEKPNFIIHCAGWTAVDLAEEQENKKRVWDANVVGTQNVVNASKKYNCKLLFISTDYVFSGQGTHLLNPDLEKYEPLNYYGVTKCEGEKIIKKELTNYFIVRISWLFGKNGNNFVKTIINASKNNAIIKVVNDQIGTPTYTKDLVVLIQKMIESNKYGCYNVSNEGGYISWYDFASEICTIIGAKTKVIPVSTMEYGFSKAKRPFNSRFDKNKLVENGFELLPNWRDALERYLKEID